MQAEGQLFFFSLEGTLWRGGAGAMERAPYLRYLGSLTEKSPARLDTPAPCQGTSVEALLDGITYYILYIYMFIKYIVCK